MIKEIIIEKNYIITINDEGIVVDKKTVTGKDKKEEILYSEITRMCIDTKLNIIGLFKGIFSSVTLKDMNKILKTYHDFIDLLEEKTEKEFIITGEKDHINSSTFKQRFYHPIEQEKSNVVSCPKCKSTDFIAGNKKFSGKRFVVGNLLAGPLGAAIGATTSKEIEITCLNCGHRWKVGKNK